MHPDHTNQLSRLNKIEGQIKGIKRMIENKRYCVDILTQVKAAAAALSKVEQGIMKTHIQGCLKTAVESKDPIDVQDKIDEIMKILNKRL